MEAVPELSAIVITPDGYETVRRTVAALRAQTARDRMEVVLVAPSREAVAAAESDLDVFPSTRLVETDRLASTAAMRAAGIRAASAPVVALTEDHSFPDPEWAAALIEAHRGDWAAVGPVMANANPASAVSWANLAIEYGPWLEPAPAGPREHLPGHNCSYKRDLLLAYGDRLEAMLEAESVLHWDLRAQGHALYLEPRARTRHLNFSTPFAWLPLRFQGGRLFAASRAGRGGWRPGRRLFYAAASPLIPLVRLVRTVRELARPGRPRGLIVRVLPALALGLAADGAGEAAGYLFGEGGTMAYLSGMEFQRHRFLSARDRKALGLLQEPQAEGGALRAGP